MKFEKTLNIAVQWWENKINKLYPSISTEKIKKFKELLNQYILDEAMSYSIVSKPYLATVTSDKNLGNELFDILESLDLDISTYKDSETMYIYEESIILDSKIIYSTEHELYNHIYSYKDDIEKLIRKIIKESNSKNTYVGRLSEEDFLKIKNESISNYKKI